MISHQGILPVKSFSHSIRRDGLLAGRPVFSLCLASTIFEDTGSQEQTYAQIADLIGSNTLSASGRAHLHIEGAEPVEHQNEIVRLLQYLARINNNLTPYTEVDTLGILIPSRDMARIIARWNIHLRIQESPRYQISLFPFQELHSSFVFHVRSDADWNLLAEQHDDVLYLSRNNCFLSPAELSKSCIEEVSRIALQEGLRLYPKSPCV